MKRLSIFLITVALIAGMMGPYGVSSDDTFPSQNLEIRTWCELDAVREYLGGNYILMNDLNSTTLGYEELASPTANGGKGWQPIGFLEVYGPTCGWSGSLTWYGLTGTFDGQGYKIRDLFINRPDEEEGCAGLFGLVLNGGIIKDIGVVNVTVTGYEDVGGLVGFNQGTVSNSYSTGNVTGYEDVGGLVGLKLSGIVSHSFWDTETSRQPTGWLDIGTGKNTTEMQDIATFSGAGWNITTVAPGEINDAYTWNIIDKQTYPFLSWEL